MHDFVSFLQKVTPRETYNLGVELYEIGRVTSVKTSGGNIRAKVHAEKKHSVTYMANPLHPQCFCSCENQFDEYCEHIIAFFLYLAYATNFDINIGTPPKYAKSDYDPEYIPSNVVMQPNNRSPLSGVFDFFRHKSAKRSINKDPVRACKDELDRLYAKAKNKKGRILNKDRILFTPIDDIASQYNDNLKILDVYIEATRYISEHMNVVDDLKGHYTDQMRHMLREMTKMTGKKQGSKLHPRIKKLFEMYLIEESDLLVSMYLETLVDMCQDQDSLKYLRNLFIAGYKKPNIATKRSMAQILEAEVLILENMNSDELWDFLENHHAKSQNLYTRYVWLLADRDKHEALAEARRAADTFPHSPAIWDMLFQISESVGGEEHARLLCQTFVRTSNWSHYDTLKSMYPDWADQTKVLMSEIQKSHNPHMRIDVLLREDRLDDALDEVMAAGDINLLDAYKYEIGHKFPNEYHKKYKEILTQILNSDLNSHDYADMMRYLSTLQELPGHDDDVRRLHAMISKKYIHVEFANMK